MTDLREASYITLARLASKLGERTVREAFPELVDAVAHEDKPYSESRIGFLAPIGKKA